MAGGKAGLLCRCLDVAQDMTNAVAEIVVIDTRSPQQYHAGHICGAISFPHRTMDATTLALLDRDKVYITYCDGIGCNGSTRGVEAGSRRV